MASPADSPGVTAYQKKYEHEGKVPPNNWISTFGGSAWEWVPAVHQYYYHYFYRAQPDLNWRNPAVEKAMFDQMRFWLDRGVAGFRLDAIPTSLKILNSATEKPQAASTRRATLTTPPSTRKIFPRSMAPSGVCAP